MEIKSKIVKKNTWMGHALTKFIAKVLWMRGKQNVRSDVYV